jgi:hypothetical protein
MPDVCPRCDRPWPERCPIDDAAVAGAGACPNGEWEVAGPTATLTRAELDAALAREHRHAAPAGDADLGPTVGLSREALDEALERDLLATTVLDPEVLARKASEDATDEA